MKGIREKLKSCKNVRNFLSNTRVIHKRFVLSFKIGNHSFQRDNNEQIKNPRIAYGFGGFLFLKTSKKV